MGNIVGEPLVGYVGDQINKRQEIYGKGTKDNPRDLEDISYFSSRTAWIKLASGTSMNTDRLNMLDSDNSMFTSTEGSALAEKNVLFGGISSLSGNTLESRQGIEGTNRAYGIGGKAFGFSPMPGIIDASVKSLNRGSIKKSTVNIKAHNKNQLDIIDVLYMRLGYTVLLEWGYNKYMDNKGKLQNMGPTLIETDFFSTANNASDYTVWLPKIEDFRKQKQGNYEAMFGIISNFSWTFESDGSYSVKVDIISMGDVIESLKTNVPLTNKTMVSSAIYAKSAEGAEAISKMVKSGGVSPSQFTKEESLGGYMENGQYPKDGDGDIIVSKANNDGYFAFELSKFEDTSYNTGTLTSVTIEGIKSKYKTRTGGDIFGLLLYQEDKPVYDDYWFFILDAEELWDAEFGSATVGGNLSGGKATRKIAGLETKDKTYQEALDLLTEKQSKEEEVEEKFIETQVTKLRESKLSYLFFSIEEIASKSVSSTISTIVPTGSPKQSSTPILDKSTQLVTCTIPPANSVEVEKVKQMTIADCVAAGGTYTYPT